MPRHRGSSSSSTASFAGAAALALLVVAVPLARGGVDLAVQLAAAGLAAVALLLLARGSDRAPWAALPLLLVLGWSAVQVLPLAGGLAVSLDPPASGRDLASSAAALLAFCAAWAVAGTRRRREVVLVAFGVSGLAVAARRPRLLPRPWPRKRCAGTGPTTCRPPRWVPAWCWKAAAPPAMPWLTRAMALNPTAPEPHQYAARCLAAEGQGALARREYRLAMLYGSPGALAEAAGRSEDVDELLQVAPDTGDGLIGLGYLLLSRQRPHDAALVFRRALEGSLDTRAMTPLAGALLAAGELEEALELARRRARRTSRRCASCWWRPPSRRRGGPARRSSGPARRWPPCPTLPGRS